MKMGRIVLILIAALAAGPSPAQNLPLPVDLELALAVDVSGSVDPEEAALQREGYIAAFRDPDVIHAITSGMFRRIAVAYYEWAGYGHMRIIADWRVIDSAESARAFADALTKDPPMRASRTAIGDAIINAIPYFDRNAFEAPRRVLDVSGDGPNNWGTPANIGRDTAVKAGITVNGLPIVNDRGSSFGWGSIPDLDLYYRDCVIGGPGSFYVVANDFKSFATAVRRKLILEIAGRTPAPEERPRVRRAATSDMSPPCDIGEIRWRNREDF